MAEQMHKFERQVDEEMRLLEALPAAGPSPAVQQRVTAAVRAEATRLRHRRIGLIWLQRAGAVAAAVLLALVLRLPGSVPDDDVTLAEADAYVVASLEALEASSDQLLAVISDPWKPEDEWELEPAVEDVLESLDETLGMTFIEEEA